VEEKRYEHEGRRGRLLYVSIRELDDTVEFYEKLLGFINGARPPFNFPGAWLYSAGIPCCILTTSHIPIKNSIPNTGVIDHVAFGSRGFEATKEHLTSQAVAYA
jgi:hypothetical protein